MLYSNFSDFMAEAIHRSEKEIMSLRNFENKLTLIVYGLMAKGWKVFFSTVSLLKLGIIAFLAVLSAFIISGVGIVAVAVLAAVGFGAYEGMKYLYKNKWYPLAILKVGSVVKSEYESNKYDDSSVSLLMDRTVEMIIRECEK